MSSEKNRITKADLKKIFWRSVPTEHSWNYERQSNCSYCFALLPILKKLYPDKKDLSESMKRHMEFFNTTPYVVGNISVGNQCGYGGETCRESG